MRVGDTEGGVFQRAKWADGCDVLSRAVKMTERCRRCEREVGSDDFGGESWNESEVSSLNGMEEGGDGRGAKRTMGVGHELCVWVASDGEVGVVGCRMR